MNAPPEEPVLCVDLDGTLVATDLLHESLVRGVKRSPWTLVRCAGWLASGRARLKEGLAADCEVEAHLLPYREEVVTFLREEHARGRRIVLATASWSTLASQVAGHLGLFDQVLATSAQGNLKGSAKARALVAAFGERGFDYVGDSRADFEVWRHARKAYAVGPVARAMPGDIRVERVFAVASSGWRAALRAMRPHQWTKNLLVFVPLLAAHRLADAGSVLAALQGFAAFCLAASSAYLLNDLADLGADRAHARKRSRPLAAGELSIAAGALLAIACLAGSFLAAWSLPRGFGAWLAAYVALTLLYSFALKRRAVVDVITLAGLYTIRIVAGAFAIAVALSFWLLAFSMFLFFSLALVKRYAELLGPASGGEAALPGRGYIPGDREVVLALGTASGMMSALVLALYMNGDTVLTLYSHPGALWLLCPLLLYWIARVWLIAARGRMDDDPVLFAARDATSYFVAAAASGVLWLAT
jgi:4-hydroxybenzoate polyprenyltransferase/phosphoserine phosphatase